MFIYKLLILVIPQNRSKVRVASQIVRKFREKHFFIGRGHLTDLLYFYIFCRSANLWTNPKVFLENIERFIFYEFLCKIFVKFNNIFPNFAVLCSIYFTTQPFETCCIKSTQKVLHIKKTWTMYFISWPSYRCSITHQLFYSLIFTHFSDNLWENLELSF